MNLAQRQRMFEQALRHRDTGIEQHINEHNFAGSALIQLYRNNYIISLSDILLQAFPTVLALVGEQFFMQLAKAYCLQQPPKSGDISRYGTEFAEHIQASEHTQSLPYLPDVAHLDWAIAELNSIVPDTAVFPFDRFSQDAAEHSEQLVFHLSSSCQILRFDYAALSIYNAVAENDFDNINIESAESVLIHTVKFNESSCKQLSDEQYHFLHAIRHGKSINELPFFEDAQSTLQSFIQTGIITGYTLDNKH